MELISQILQEQDLVEILDLEKQNLTAQYPDETERMMALWSSKTREEALRQYLSFGWSFVVRNKSNSSLAGYFIAQPLLFFNGHTQSLWVEHLSATSVEARQELIMIAYKLGREKNLQRVYFPKELEADLSQYRGEPWDPQMIMVRTTKG